MLTQLLKYENHWKVLSLCIQICYLISTSTSYYLSYYFLLFLFVQKFLNRTVLLGNFGWPSQTPTPIAWSARIYVCARARAHEWVRGRERDKTQFITLKVLHMWDFSYLLFDLVMGNWNFRLYNDTENYCNWNWRHWTQDFTFSRT